MNEPKSQLRIVSALLIVVIALAGGLFFFMPQTISANTGNVTPPEDLTPPHAKVRDAEISLDPALIFSQTFGGSGDETIVDIYSENDKIYIFGNTTSDDIDFDASGAFVAILGSNGKTLGFVSYEGTLKAVTLYNGGYVMALDRDNRPVALAIDYNGEEIKTTVLPTNRDEETLDIKYADTGYMLVTALVQNITGYTRLKLNLLDRSLEYSGSVLTDEAHSLEYLYTFDVAGEYRLMANAKSDIGDMLCIGTWGKSLAHYPKEFSYLVRDFWIIDDFYYLSVTDTATLLIKESGELLELGNASAHTRMAGDATHMYISADNMFYCTDGNKIIFSAEYGTTSFFIDSYIYTVSNAGNGKIAVRSFVGGNKAFESVFNCEMTDPKIFICQNGMFVIGNTNGKFGGTDITLLKVNY